MRYLRTNELTFQKFVRGFAALLFHITQAVHVVAIIVVVILRLCGIGVVALIRLDAALSRENWRSLGALARARIPPGQSRLLLFAHRCLQSSEINAEIINNQ